MTMKQLPRLTAAALLGAGAIAAHAQGAPASAVTLYGIVDVGVEVVNKVNAVGSIQRMPSNTSLIPSRVGMRGSEDLGGGLRGVFNVEMGFAPDTGVSGQGGRLFGRQSFVGLAGPWGSVTLGRQYSQLFWSVVDSDVIGPSVYALGSLDAYIPNARADNSVAYRGTFGAFSVGAGYSLGRDAVNAGPSPAGTNCAGENGSDDQACRQFSALAKYDTGAWGVSLGYDSQRGRTVTTATGPVFGGLDSSNKKDNRVLLGTYVKFGDTKVGAGWLRRDNDGTTVNPKSDIYYIGASYPVTPALSLEGQVLNLRYKNVDDRDAMMYVARVIYNLSKRTAVYTQVGHISNDRLSNLSVSGGAPGSNPAAGSSQTGVNAGIRHTF